MKWKARSATPMAMALLASTLVAGPLLSQTFGVVSDDPELELFVQRVDSLLPELMHEFLTPGAAVALLRDGHAAWGRGYGFADVATLDAVTPQTVFNIGSISKTVAAWGVMKLVEEDRLELDVSVETYLTRWHLPPSDFDKDGVNIRRLLSHTAGLSLPGYPGFFPNEQLPTLEQSLSGATNGPGAVQLIMDPGNQWRYSGGGFTIAQLVVEEATGQRFADYMRKEVLVPLGMTSSDYDWSSKIEENAATPYNGVGEPIPGPRFTAAAAAGLETSLEDFVRFAEASLPHYKGPCDAPCLLSPETVDLMQSPAPASPNYGLGYRIRQQNGMTFVGHGGANQGWMAQFLVVPQTGDGIIIMTNSSNGNQVHGPLVCAWQNWLAAGEPQPCRRNISGSLLRVVLDDGVDAAIERYHLLRRTAYEGYDFGEFQLNSLGYQLLARLRIDDAIEIFRLNVWAYPDAWNTYDSLGEGYYAAGLIELALANYERSLKLNPENENSYEMLSRLRQGLPYKGFEEFEQ